MGCEVITVVEVDAQSGEVLTRPATAEEVAAMQVSADAMAAAKAEADAIEATATSARLKIAEASGLTPEEMAALGF